MLYRLPRTHKWGPWLLVVFGLALASCNPSASLDPAILQNLHSTEEAKQIDAIQKLGQAHAFAPQAAHLLLPFLRSPKDPVATAAIRSIAQLGHHAKIALTPLQTLLLLADRKALHPPAKQAIQTIEAAILAARPKPTLSWEDAQAALKSPDKVKRLNALLDLPKFYDRTTDVIPLLIALLDDDEKRLRLTAAKTIGAFGKTAVPFVVKALEAPSERLQINATYLLAEIRQDLHAAIPSLHKNLSHKNWKLRRASARTIAFAGPPAKVALPALVKLLQETDPTVRENALIAIAKVAPAEPSTLEPLRKATHDKILRVQISAYFALAHFGRPALSELQTALASKETELRKVALYGLSFLPPSDASLALPWYKTLAKDKDPDIRITLLQQLSRLPLAQAQTLLPVVESMIADYHPRVGLTAKRLLRRWKKELAASPPPSSAPSSKPSLPR